MTEQDEYIIPTALWPVSPGAPALTCDSCGHTYTILAALPGVDEDTLKFSWQFMPQATGMHCPGCGTPNMRPFTKADIGKRVEARREGS